MSNIIKCPYCGKEVEISEALSHQIEEKLLQDIKTAHSRELEEATKKAEESAVKKINEKNLLELKNAKKEAEEEKERSNKLLNQLENLNSQFRELRRKDEERELEMSKKLVEEEERIRKEASGKAEEEQKYKILEKDKVINDLKSALDDMRKKAQQGSQQLQGEVLELDLEDKLRNAFVYDEITPIGKGVQGADVLQAVRNQAGKAAGSILWETKRAKWTPSWLPKLKEDGRKNDATMVVLVSENLPKAIEHFKVMEGVLVTSIAFALQLAAILRRSLMQIAAAKVGVENKDEKLQMLYEYIQSDAFRHRFEAFADGVKAMEEDLLTERRSMERIWKKRETQLKRMQLNTSRMFGELQGVMENKLPDIKTLKLDSGED